MAVCRTAWPLIPLYPALSLVLSCGSDASPSAGEDPKTIALLGCVANQIPYVKAQLDSGKAPLLVLDGQAYGNIRGQPLPCDERAHSVLRGDTLLVRLVGAAEALSKWPDAAHGAVEFRRRSTR